MRAKRSLTLLFVFVFLDILGFSLILPLLPFYAATFGASPTLVGLLLGANALTQLIGTAVMGRLSDRYGRRPLLIVSIAGTVVGFLLLGLANSLWLLFVSRIVDGLLGGDLSLAQAYIADVTDEGNRARGLGLVGAAFGLGFIIGPAIGGVLSAGNNFARPALFAAALSLFTLVSVLLWLPESLPPERRARRAASPRAAFSVQALWEALRRPCVGPLLNVRFVFGLAFTAFQTVFALYAQARLGLTAQSTSYVLTYVGVLAVAVQGGAIGPLTRRFREKQLIFGSAGLLALALLAWALAPSLVALLIVLAPMALAGGTLGVAINSALTKSVFPEEVGGTLGLGGALDSLARIVAPVVGAFLLDQWGSWAPGIAGALLMTVATGYVWRKVLFVPDLACPAEY